MLKSLYFKIVLILLIFIIAVMCAVGAILISGVTNFYADDFTEQMEECFAPGGLIMNDISAVAESDSYATEIKNILQSYGSILGVDKYRNYYVLDTEGEMLTGSDIVLGSSLAVTPNILSAINDSGKNIASGGMDYSDYAVRIHRDGGEDVIVYVKDSLEEMRQLSQVIFTIILQTIAIGIVIAVLLSFFLAKSISSPLRTLTYGAQLVASGEFNYEIKVSSSDEIGVLAENFNYMRERLRATIEEVDGEREKLETVLSCMRDAVLAFNANGTVMHSNNSAETLFGEELINGNMDIEKCFELLDIPLVIRGNSVILTSPDAEVEKTHDGFIFHDRSYDSKVFDVNFAVIRYVSGKKQSSGCVLIIHDVTARFELDESRREFVANVSHELRTPLTSIKGAAETIVLDPDMDEKTRTYFLDMVLSESDRMTRIVSDLLVLSRLDNKRTKWNIEQFDICASVKRLCEVMKSDLEAHEHTVSFETSKEHIFITGDKQRIEQVVINIMSNANKYTAHGGHIDIDITSDVAKSVKICITDNGIGIPKEDIDHLFERFYRVEKSRNQDAGGTGLGLAIAKEIVEAHGGHISVESILGVGTSVTIELPAECKIKTDKM